MTLVPTLLYLILGAHGLLPLPFKFESTWSIKFDSWLFGLKQTQILLLRSNNSNPDSTAFYSYNWFDPDNALYMLIIGFACIYYFNFI